MTIYNPHPGPILSPTAPGQLGNNRLVCDLLVVAVMACTGRRRIKSQSLPTFPHLSRVQAEIGQSNAQLSKTLPVKKRAIRPNEPPSFHQSLS
jgi:hypothetical protein